MRKGQSLFDLDKTAIYFTPNDNIVPVPEEFKPITEQVVPDILPYYLISNYGRIFHKYKGQYLTNNVDTKGYLYKPLATKNGSKSCRIHRLVLMTFGYIEGCENLFVNHIDGNKCNPCIWNLEWVDRSENEKHAHRTGLYINHIKESDVEKVCMLLENPNITMTEVSLRTGVPYHIVQAIQGKRTWCNISDKYDIKRRKVNNNLSIEEVHLLCKYFQDVKKPDDISIRQYCRDGLECIGIPNCSWLQLRSALKILNKDTYKHVSKEYNF